MENEETYTLEFTHMELISLSMAIGASQSYWSTRRELAEHVGDMEKVASLTRIIASEQNLRNRIQSHYRCRS